MATSGDQFSHPLGMGGEQEVFGIKITLERDDDDGLKSANFQVIWPPLASNFLTLLVWVVNKRYSE